MLKAGLLLEAVARKIRRHKGEFTDLELQVIHLHVETALSKIPSLSKPGEAQTDNGSSLKVRTGRSARHRPRRA